MTTWYELFQGKDWDTRAKLADLLVQEGLLARQEQSVLLLYGSFVSGDADQFSDLDLLEIRECSEMEQETMVAARGLVDITSLSLAELRRRLRMRCEGNNNFLLNALRNSVVLLDGRGEGITLQLEAQAVYKEGPPFTNQAFLLRKLKGLTKLWLTLESYARRAHASESDARLFSFRSSQLLIKTVEAHHEAMGVWSDSIRHLVARKGRGIDEAREVWRSYVMSGNDLRGVINLLGAYLEKVTRLATAG